MTTLRGSDSKPGVLRAASAQPVLRSSGASDPVLRSAKRSTVLSAEPRSSEIVVSSTGAQGPAGPSGPIGFSAYEIWLGEGNAGSEADFLATLKGERGDVGPAGAPGNSNYRSLTFQSPEGGPFETYPTAYREIVGGVFPSAVVWYEDETKTRKIFERQIVRDAQQNPITITQILYNTDGETPLTQSVDTIVMSGPFELSRTRVTL